MRPLIIIGLAWCLIVMLLIISVDEIYGTNSVIIQDVQGSSTFTIDCLGDDNLLNIYSLNSNGEEEITYRGICDGQEKLRKQYLENAYKIQIRNGEDSETLINYEEILNTIESENANAQIEEFSDKVCITIVTTSWSDITILGDTTQQIKNFYECYTRESLNNLPTGDLENEVILEVFINDRLFQEFTLNKPVEELRISFSDLALIDEKNEDFINIKFTNPTGKLLKVNVIDTNLGCPSKSFQLSDTFSMLCNKTSLDVPIYFIQVKDDLNRVTFKEYQIPPSNDKSSGFSFWWIVIAVAIVLIIAYNNYRGNIETKNQSSYDSLDNDIDERDYRDRDTSSRR